jgi:uncharacterized damage-inducible protein DinB
MNYSLDHHLAYSVWANETLIDRLKKLDDSIFHQEVKSSFPTIAKTLLHMWDAEVVWLKRFQGVSLAEWPSKDFKGTIADLLSGVVKSSKDIQAFVASHGEAFVKGRRQC